MTREEITEAIRATALDNDGQPLGMQRFERVTGIKKTDWWGVYWASWGEAVQDAGLRPNKFKEGYDPEWLVESLARIVKDLGAWPAEGRLRLYCRSHPDLPNGKTYRERLGNKAAMVREVLRFCKDRDDFADVVLICSELEIVESHDEIESEQSFGYVYLMKSGKYHKIGRTNSVGRRGYELATQLPEKLTTVHTIKTDDPVGVEAYWHRRFDGKRHNGEWFLLDIDDVKAFKRWIRIC